MRIAQKVQDSVQAAMQTKANNINAITLKRELVKLDKRVMQRLKCWKKQLKTFRNDFLNFDFIYIFLIKIKHLAECFLS